MSSRLTSSTTTLLSVALRVLLMLVALPAGAAGNWYVRPSSAGSSNGTNWANAWSISSIAWASVQPGDTIWMAGGNYSGTMTTAKAGTAGSPISIKRVLSTDSVPVAAAGWSSSFDSQIVWTISGGIAVRINSAYVVLDGRVGAGDGTATPYGMKFHSTSGSTTIIAVDATNSTVRYIASQGLGLDYAETNSNGGNCDWSTDYRLERFSRQQPD